MKILFITHYDNMYGANNAMRLLALALNKREDYEVMAVIPADGELSHTFEENGIRCIISPITAWQATYVSPLRQAVKKHIRKRAIKAEIKELYEILKSENIDLIHSNSSVIGHGAFLAKMLGCMHVWHIREFSKEHFNMRYFYKKKDVISYYESAKALICISDSLKDNYKEKYPAANIVRIYDGVNEKRANSIVDADKSNEKTGVFSFVYVGYLYQKKHQLDVIRACKKLEMETDIPFEMIFVGDGKNDYKDTLKLEIEKLGLSSVKLLGYVKDANEFVSRCDAGIIASEYEGFGLVTVEYMLNKLPVIGYKSGGTAEIIEDGKTGILYLSEDELVNAMKKLISDKELCKQYGENGYNRAKNCFSEELNIQAIADLYERIRVDM